MERFLLCAFLAAVISLHQIDLSEALLSQIRSCAPARIFNQEPSNVWNNVSSLQCDGSNFMFASLNSSSFRSQFAIYNLGFELPPGSIARAVSMRCTIRGLFEGNETQANAEINLFFCADGRNLSNSAIVTSYFQNPIWNTTWKNVTTSFPISNTWRPNIINNNYFGFGVEIRNPSQSFTAQITDYSIQVNYDPPAASTGALIPTTGTGATTSVSGDPNYRVAASSDPGIQVLQTLIYAAPCLPFSNLSSAKCDGESAMSITLPATARTGLLRFYNMSLSVPADAQNLEVHLEMTAKVSVPTTVNPGLLLMPNANTNTGFSFGSSAWYFDLDVFWSSVVLAVPSTSLTPQIVNTNTFGVGFYIYPQPNFAYTYDLHINCATILIKYALPTATTTNSLTTQSLTTKTLTTQSLTTKSLTTLPTTTQTPTTQELTTSPLTTQSLTTKTLTTLPTTTQTPTTQELTTSPLTTQSLTTKSLTTQALSTEAVTSSHTSTGTSDTLETSEESSEAATSATTNAESFSSSKEKRSAVPIAVGVPVAALIILGGAIAAFVLWKRRRSAMRNYGAPLEDAMIRGRNSREIPLQNVSALPSFLDIRFSEIKMKHKLGNGQFGEVFKGLWRNQDVAVKQVKQGSAVNTKAFVEEAQLMLRLRPHANVVQLLGICRSPPCIVMRFYENGSLLLYLRANRHLEWKFKLDVMTGIAAGMSHLHMEGVVHRDLAARNVLLSSKLEPVVSDFGFARLVENETGVSTTYSSVGPVKHMPPESLTDKIYSTKTDAYAFGITCYEIITQEEPYKGLDNINTISKVLQGYRMPLPENLDPRVASMIKKCWSVNPDERPSLQACYDILEGCVGNVAPVVQPGYQKNDNPYSLAPEINTIESDYLT